MNYPYFRKVAPTRVREPDPYRECRGSIYGTRDSGFDESNPYNKVTKGQGQDMSCPYILGDSPSRLYLGRHGFKRACNFFAEKGAQSKLCPYSFFAQIPLCELCYLCELCEKF